MFLPFWVWGNEPGGGKTMLSLVNWECTFEGFDRYRATQWRCTFEGFDRYRATQWQPYNPEFCK